MLEAHKKDMQRVSAKAARSVEQAATRDSKDQLERVRAWCPAAHLHAGLALPAVLHGASLLSLNGDCPLWSMVMIQSSAY